MSKNKEATGGRSWWRNLFHDHPGAATKSRDAYVESETGNTKTLKVYCKPCLTADIQQIISEDLSSINQGRLNAVRTEHEIETYCELIIWFVLQYNWADIHRNFVECGTNRGQAVEQEDSFATP
jgi:hypothetical protein